MVYHGGENNISSFITYHQDSEVGDMYGAYFTKDKKYAKTYNKGTLYEVFLNIKNPLATEGNWTGIISKEQKEAVTAKHDGIINDKFDNGILQKLHLVKTRTEVIVFNPNQVKSATNNNSNFSLTNDDIQAAWGKKRREIYNNDLETQEINAIQKHIETLSKETDTSNGLWHIVSYTRGVNKGKTFAYKFNTSLHQYEQNRKDKHDGFEILKKRDITNFSKEQINKLENDIKNRRNIDSVLSEQGTWNEEGTLYDSDVIVDHRQDEGNNDRLDKEALQGESNGRQDNRNSRDNQGESEIETFTTPQGEVFGFVDKEGNIYLDETKITPEHPIHEYTHLWDRALQQRNPELWNRGVELMKQTSLWNEILNNENYGKLWQAKGMPQEQLDNLIASEVHARLTGVEYKGKKNTGMQNMLIKLGNQRLAPLCLRAFSSGEKYKPYRFSDVRHNLNNV